MFDISYSLLKNEFFKKGSTFRILIHVNHSHKSVPMTVSCHSGGGHASLGLVVPTSHVVLTIHTVIASMYMYSTRFPRRNQMKFSHYFVTRLECPTVDSCERLVFKYEFKSVTNRLMEGFKNSSSVN